jgi:hypothetical protein
MSESMKSEEFKAKLVIGSASGMAGTVLVGYVVWALRGASLVASALSSLPIWRCFDPLPVITGKSRERDKEDLGVMEELDGDERRVEELFSSSPDPHV